MSLVTPEVARLLKDKNFASFATTMPDGSPQVSPVWVDYDDNLILVNTARGRIKEKNIQTNRKVALSIFDMNNPYEMVTIKGIITEQTTNGADEHIDKMSKKYLNLDKYPLRKPDEIRLLLKIRPEKVFHLSIPIRNIHQK
jgi:PPOX class probable F420-dependent enzyme